MGVRSDYKKKTTAECHWCDYSGSKCKRNKKCSWYKRWVKKIVDNKKTPIREAISMNGNGDNRKGKEVRIW